jgi:hypothetical protein
MRLLGMLFTPLNYLRITHDDKRWFDIWFPLIITSVVFAVYLMLPQNINFLGNNGLITKVNGLLQILIGFYIASLGAVATFSSPNMDHAMSGVPPKLKEKREGKSKNVILTRRRFLSYLFGYLAFVSLFLFGFGLVAEVIYPAINLLVTASMKMIVLIFYVMVFSNIMITTLLGLFYLTYRIHIYDPELD